MLVRFVALLIGAWVLAPSAYAETVARIASPDNVIAVEIDINDEGRAGYAVTRNGVPVIALSRLGFLFVDAPKFERNLELTAHSQRRFDERWEQPWGEERFIRNRYNELLLAFTERSGSRRRFDVVFRVYDDGLGFRYELPAQPALREVRIQNELTEFTFAQGGEAFWTEGFGWNREEYPYNRTQIEGIGVAQTPLTVRLGDGTHVAIHEAALVDYSGMNLMRTAGRTLRAALTPGIGDAAVVRTAPFHTPWRTLQITGTAGELVESRLILNLNEPNAIGEVSWFRPGKYVGIWWQMHLGTATWASGPNHGATTETTLRYIDFAARHGFRGVLVEGWNVGWDGDWFGNGEAFSFTQAYPDFDLERVAAYARERGVQLIGHHETSANAAHYEAQMEDAFALYERLGVGVVKTGYVSDAGQARVRAADGAVHYAWHEGQEMARHHERVVRAAARHRIAINPHEPIKDTGLRRTYPNWVSREGARGMEYNAWGNPGNPSRARSDACIHAPARGADGLHAGDIRNGDARAGWRGDDVGQATRALRRDLQPDPDGGRSVGELRSQSPSVPVHHRRTRRLGGDPRSQWRDRRFRDHRAQGPQQRRLVSGRDHRRGGPHARRTAHLPRPPPPLPGPDLSRRTDRELARRGAARHRHRGTHRHQRRHALACTGAGRGPGHPLPPDRTPLGCARAVALLVPAGGATGRNGCGQRRSAPWSRNTQAEWKQRNRVARASAIHPPSCRGECDKGQHKIEKVGARTMTRAKLTFFQIWNMCFGFFGIQMGFGLQNANTSRIFQTLGANIDDLAVLWIAAPATGLLVQPIIGYFSDRTWGWFGRRRPYFFFGAIFTTIALVFMPNAPVLWVAAGALWIMDASINVTMEPFRAFVGDNLPDEQRTFGYAMQSFFIGLGAVLASALPWIMTNWFDVSNVSAPGEAPESVRLAFYIGAACLLGAVMWTVFTTREYTPEELAKFEEARLRALGAAASPAPAPRKPAFYYAGGMVWTLAGAALAGLVTTLDLEKELFLLAALIAGFGAAQLAAGWLRTRKQDGNGFLEIIEDLFQMPRTMRGLAIVQFFSWFALFAMWIYTTSAVTSYHYGATSTSSRAYNDGADWVGVLFAAYNGVAAIAALIIPTAAAIMGRRLTHAANLTLGAVGLFSFFWIRDPQFLLISMIGVGFAWASILSVPYSILAGALPAGKMGVYMGIFNIFIVVPQLLAATMLGALLKSFFGGEPVFALALGGGAMLLAALSVTLVQDPGAKEKAQ